MRDVGRGCTAAAGGRTFPGCIDDGGDGAAGARGRQLQNDAPVLRRDHDQQVVDGAQERTVEEPVGVTVCSGKYQEAVAHAVQVAAAAAPGYSMAVSATRRAYACRRWTGGAAGADLEVGRAGWLFRCRLCAAASSCGRAVTSAMLPNGAFSYTTSLTPAVPALAAALFAARRLWSEVQRGPAEIRLCGALRQGQVPCSIWWR